MLLLRKILFYVFFLMYLIFCPVVILQAFGYFVYPLAKKTVIETGLVSLVSNPSGATIFVENRRFTKRTPAVVRGLLPQSYTVRLSMKNYKPWSRTVSVEAGRATVMDRILLLPQQLSMHEIISEECEELVALPGTPYFLVVKDEKLKDCFLYDGHEETLRPLIKIDDSFSDMRFVSCVTVEGSPYFLLQAEDGNKEPRYLWGDVRKEQVVINDISSLLPASPIQYVEWDVTYPKYLFIAYDNDVYRLNTVTRTMFPKFMESVNGYGLFERMVYSIAADQSFVRSDMQKSTRVYHKKYMPISPLLAEIKGFFRIKALTRDTLIFIGEKGELLSNLLPYYFVDKGIVGTAYYADTKQLLMWQKERIGVINFMKDKDREDIFEHGPQVQWIHEKGKNIEQAFWVYNGSHILFRDKDKVYLVDVHTSTKNEPEFIVQIRRKSNMVYQEATGKLFFLDAEHGRLSVVRILPRTDMINFQFPEIRKDEEPEEGAPEIRKEG